MAAGDVDDALAAVDRLERSKLKGKKTRRKSSLCFTDSVAKPIVTIKVVGKIPYCFFLIEL